MTKMEIRLQLSGNQRREIDVDLMTQAVIALGGELARRKQGRRKAAKMLTPSAADRRAAP
jgi:hypothetical protein